MRCVTRAFAGTMVLAALMAGCAAPGPARQSSGRSATAPAPIGELVGSRPTMPLPDVAALASHEKPIDGSSAAGAYRVLKPFDAQCAAAAQCAVANALWYESGIVGSQAENGEASKGSACVRKKAMAYRAADERNKASALALELFYLLAEAEANRDFIARGQTQVDAVLKQIDDLQSHGIRVEKGGAEFRRQQLELLDRQSELQLNLAQANSHLRQLLGSCFEETTPIWPDADWKVAVDPIDTNSAVCEGLYRRADLNLIRMLIQSLDADSLEGVRSTLAVITGMVGVPKAALCRLHTDSDDEIDARRRQLNDLLTRQELAAAEEIRQAVVTIEIRLQQVAVAKQKVDHFRDQLRIQRLSRERPGSTVTALDVAAADMKLLDAQRDLVHQVVAVRIAQVKLKESQGLLVFECCGCR